MSTVDLRPEGSGPSPWAGWRRSVALLAILGGCLVLTLLYVTGDRDPELAPPVATTTTPSGTTPGRAEGDDRTELVYLALGDSLSRGVQPDGGKTLKNGYPRIVNRALRREITPRPTLVEAGCGGATTTSMIEGGKACAPDAPIPYGNADRSDSQLVWAVQQLEARKDLPTLVTLTIGGNDLTTCLDTSVRKVESCLRAAIPTMKTNWDVIARRLHAVAGPKTVLSVVTTYDPVLGYVRLAGGENADAARAFHRIVVRRVNPIMRRVFEKYGWEVADLAEAMHERSSIKARDSRAVAAVCYLTWACGNFDVHLNDEGYELAAEVIEASVIDRVMAVAGTAPAAGGASG